MRIRIEKDLLLLNIMVALLVTIITYFPVNILRSFIGLPFVLFMPGYSFVALIFPKKKDLNVFERVALSFCWTIVVSPLVGFLFHFSPWGITLHTNLFYLALIVFIFSAATWYRRLKLPENERFTITLNIPLSGWRKMGALDKALSIFLVFSIFSAVGFMSYTVFYPSEVEEKFSEFYILGRFGKAADYPRELKVGAIAKVTVGIINHEREEISYLVKIRIGGEIIGESWSVTLDDGEKKEQGMAFSVSKVGMQKVEFLLYRTGSIESYRSVYLWLDVKEQQERFTEFYANIDPSELVVNQTAHIKVVIVNHEGEAVQFRLYLLESWIAHTRLTSEYGEDIIEVGDEEEWMGQVSTFLDFDPLYQQTIDVQLWKVGEEVPYKTTTLRFFAQNENRGR